VKVIKIAVLVIMSLLLFNCANNKIQDSFDEMNMNKLEPKLKSRVKELISQKRSDEELQILGKYETISSEELKNKIIEYGGKVETITSTIFTVRCSVKTITILSNKDFIKYLELSKKMNLKKEEK